MDLEIFTVSDNTEDQNREIATLAASLIRVIEQSPTARKDIDVSYCAIFTAIISHAKRSNNVPSALAMLDLGRRQLAKHERLGLMQEPLDHTRPQ